MVLAALAAGVAAPMALATAAQADSVRKVTITISCFRGPWEEVIWDRPNARFIESLVAAGYDFPTAHAIGERICRDEALVGNPDAAKDAMAKVMAEAPTYRRR